jgi:hypothetical protein
MIAPVGLLRGGNHNMEVERQTISLFYCRKCLTDGG